MAHDLEKKWRTQDVRLQEELEFDALLLSDRVLSGLRKAGFKKPSPIQLDAIPMGRFGKDLFVQAKSGTGKTLVFVIVALEMLRHKLLRPQVMVLVPTREIATQICSVVKLVGSAFPKLTCCSFIGGMSVNDDKEKAVTSQIVVGTPGRIKQLVTLKCLPTNSIRLLVFDEADQLLETSFKQDIDDIFNSLPQDKQVVATSATYPAKLAKLILKYLREPYMACLNKKEIALLGIIHYAKVLKFTPMPLLVHRHKLEALEKIMKSIKFSQCLLFCNGIHRVEVLYKEVKKWGFSTAFISSAKEQCDRLKAIDRLKNFKCKVLVSSDVAARGIDAENVDLVVNFDLALTTETYMHRAGRAGRYGSIGVTITIMNDNEIEKLQKMETEASFKTYILPEPVPLDLIKKPFLGEYVIEEPKLAPINSETEQECVVPDEAEISISDNNESNLIKVIEAENIVPKESKQMSSVGNFTEAKKDELSDSIPKHLKLDDNESSDVINSSISVGTVVDTSTDKVGIDNANERPNDLNAEPFKNLDLINGKFGIDNANGNSVDLGAEPFKNVDLINNKVGIDNTNGKSNDLSAELFINPDLINDASGIRLNNKSSHVIKLEENINGEFRSFNKEFDDLSKKDDLPKSSESEKMNNSLKDAADLNCKYVNYINLCNKLNYHVKSYISKHEITRSMESSILNNTDESDKEKQMTENSKVKGITADMIHDLNSKRADYFYKVFKKYEAGNKSDSSNEERLFGEHEESNDYMTSYKEIIEEKVNAVTSMSFQNEVLEQDNCALEVANKELNDTDHTSFFENSESENVEDFCEKPNYESTPHLGNKTKDESFIEAVDQPKHKLEDQSNIQHLFQELSDSDDPELDFSELHKELTLDELQYSSSDDSESDSCTSDSSSFSSAPSLSSDDEASENQYHHNKFRTGKQNPSLVSDSSMESLADLEKRNSIHTEKRFSKNPHSSFVKKYHQPFYPANEKSFTRDYCGCLRKEVVMNRKCIQNTSEAQNHSLQSYFGRHSICSSSCFRPSELRYYNGMKCHVCHQRQLCQQWFEAGCAAATRKSSKTWNHPEQSVCFRQHSACNNCFQPSQHKCLKGIKRHICNEGPAYSPLSGTFCSQWQHLQNVINGGIM